MATCKDCIHNSVCSLWRAEEGQDAKSYAETLGGGCSFFANKFRLVGLPCKVGDEVYVPAVCTERLIRFVIVRCEIYAEEIIFTDDSDNEYHIEDFGKIVFLTREEAEAELQKRTHKPQTAPDNAEHCVCCGDVIPEGRQVCPKCEKGT